jgi:copper chaperone CopZ
MRKIILAATLLLAPAATLAAEAEIRLHVTGLTCPSCSYIVATALKKIETVEITEFTEGEADDGVYVLTYDDAATAPGALIEVVTGVGYGAALAVDGGS